MSLERPPRSNQVCRRPIFLIAPWMVIGLVACLTGCPEEGTGVDENTDVSVSTPRPRNTPPGGTVQGDTNPSDGSSPIVLKTPPPGGAGVGGNITGTLPSATPAPPISQATPTPAPTMAPITRPVDGGSTLPSASPLPVPSNPVGGI